MNRTFVISECGINHLGDVEMAKRMIELSKEAGCDAVKFQTYKTDLRSSPDSNIYAILKQCELSYGQQIELKVYADSVGIEFFSTPFDEEALSFLVDKLGIRRVKLSSFDVTNRKMLAAVNEYAANLPALNVILSTGMANFVELRSALECMPNVRNLTLLHCISAYPCPQESANLNVINNLRNVVGSRAMAGYSDHTSDILVPALSVLAGATVVEKHFTLDLDNGAPDNSVSADPDMMKHMVEIIRMHEQIMGDGAITMHDVETGCLQYRTHS